MNRRRALKLGASSALTAIVAKASGVADFFGVAEAQSPPPPPQSVGERYGDSLILSADSARPLLDHEPDAQFIPSLEQLTGGAPPTGETIETTAAEAARRLGFHVYRLTGLPAGFTERAAEVTQHVSGRVFGVTIAREARDKRGHQIPVASVVISRDPPMPVPAWIPRDLEAALEKVSYLPTLGIRTSRGPIETLQWVEEARLFSVTYRRDILDLPPDQVAARLERLS